MLSDQSWWSICPKTSFLSLKLTSWRWFWMESLLSQLKNGNKVFNIRVSLMINILMWYGSGKFYRVILKNSSQLWWNSWQEVLDWVSKASSTLFPIYRKMACNRGKLNSFELVSMKYDPLNPYPQGMTCFNRLILPLYQDKAQQEFYLNLIINSDF